MMAYFVEKDACNGQVTRPLKAAEVLWTFRDSPVHDDFDPGAVTSPAWVIPSQNNSGSASPHPSNLPPVGGCGVRQHNRREAADMPFRKG
jgi:hypothetical protein